MGQNQANSERTEGVKQDNAHEAKKLNKTLGRSHTPQKLNDSKKGKSTRISPSQQKWKRVKTPND